MFIDKIKLTNQQIKQFEILTQQFIRGLMMIKKRIFQLYGNNGWNEVIVIIGLITGIVKLFKQIFYYTKTSWVD